MPAATRPSLLGLTMMPLTFVAKSPAGTLAILQRRTIDPTTAWVDVGSATINATTIETDTGVTFAANTSYQLRVLSRNSFDQDSLYPSEPFRFDLGAAKAVITPPPPLRPKFVTVKQLPSGKFRVAWYYDPYGQGTFPDKFKVYEGAAVGTINYGVALTDSVTALDYTVATPGRRVYTFTTAALAESLHVFGVRAEISGNSDGNTETVSISAKGMVTPPTAPAGFWPAPVEDE